MEGYTHSALKIVVAQMCQVLGWHAMQPVTLDILVDILHKYLMKLGSTTCEYALLANRTEPNLDDLFSTFHQMRINLEEMRSFVQHVEMPRSLANFPFKQQAVSKLRFDHCTSGELYVCSPNERLQCIPSYMPPLSESSKEQREDDEESGFGDLPELQQVGAHREDTVGSHAEPPAPRPLPPVQSESPRQEDDVTHKLETDLRLSEDEAQETDKPTTPNLSATNTTSLQQDDVSSLSRVDTDLTFAPLSYSPTAVLHNLSDVAEDWSNPPETVEISASQVLNTEDAIESADSTDSTSDTDNEKIELILPDAIQDPLLPLDTPQQLSSPAHAPSTPPVDSQAENSTHKPTSTKYKKTPDRILEGSKRLEQLRRESEQRLERIGHSETCLDELIGRQWDSPISDTSHGVTAPDVTCENMKDNSRLILNRTDISTYPPPTPSSTEVLAQPQANLPVKKRLIPTHESLHSSSSLDMTPDEVTRPPIRLSLNLKKKEVTSSTPTSPLPISIPLSTLSLLSPSVNVLPKIKVKSTSKRDLSLPPKQISSKKMKPSKDSESDQLLVSIPLSSITLPSLSITLPKHTPDLLEDTDTPWSISIPLQKLDRKPIHPGLTVESSLTLEVSSIERVDIGIGGHREYLCPMCNNGYDGSLMICCDGNCTDTWYHGKCVGIGEAPGPNQTWFCPQCSSKQNVHTSEHKKHKKTKKHKKHRHSHSESVTSMQTALSENDLL